MSNERAAVVRDGPVPLVRRLVELEPGEWPLAAGSFLYFFFLLAGYYTLRPVRDALAVGAGVENIQYLFLTTFLVMLAIVPAYGWIVSRVPRRILLPLVYLFFALNLLAFRGWFASSPDDPLLTRVFFVWVSIFNLFVVSVFWSFMADLWSSDQARRLFGLIAAGGSAGAVVGPLITSQLAERIGVENLLLVSTSLLLLALGFLLWLIAKRRDAGRVAGDNPQQPMGGDILAGAKLIPHHRYLQLISAFMILGTLTGSMLYLLQAKIVSLNFDTPATVTSVFANVDLAVNLLTIVIQITLTSRIVNRFGVGIALAILPVVATVGFAAITFAPGLLTIVAVQVLRRGVLFALTNPVSHMLYTVVGPQSRYKFKHFCETVVYRAGDTTGSSLFAAIMTTGAGLPVVAVTGMILAGGWTLIGLRIGNRFKATQSSETQLP